MDFFNVVCGITIVLLAMALVLFLVWLIIEAVIRLRDSILLCDEFDAYVEVIDKEYYRKSTVTDLIPCESKISPINRYRPEEFNVTVEFAGEAYTFDSQELFDDLEVGDVFKVQVNIKFTRSDKIKDIYLSVGSNEAEWDGDFER